MSVTEGFLVTFWGVGNVTRRPPPPRLGNISACVSCPRKDLHTRALVLCLFHVFEVLHGLWGRFACFSPMPGERPGNVTGNMLGSPPPPPPQGKGHVKRVCLKSEKSQHCNPRTEVSGPLEPFSYPLLPRYACFSYMSINTQPSPASVFVSVES